MGGDREKLFNNGVRSDLEPVELLSTGSDRPVEILELTGKTPAKTGEKWSV